MYIFVVHRILFKSASSMYIQQLYHDVPGRIKYIKLHIWPMFIWVNTRFVTGNPIQVCLLPVCLIRSCTGVYLFVSRWHHQMETFSALLAFYAGNSPVTGELPAQRPVTRSFDVFFDLRLNKQLSKQWRCWWFKTPLRSLLCHCNLFLSVKRMQLRHSTRQLNRGRRWITSDDVTQPYLVRL